MSDFDKTKYASTLQRLKV